MQQTPAKKELKILAPESIALATAHYKRGKELFELYKDTEALIAFNKALAIHPTFAAAHYECGEVLLKMNDYPEALTAFDKALLYAPGNATTHMNRGFTLCKLGQHRYNEALAAYDAALLIAPNAIAYASRGCILGLLKRDEEALAAYDDSLAINPEDVTAQHSRGWVLNALGRHEEAIPAFSRTLALNPNCAMAYSNRGYAFHKLKKPIQAWQDCAAALAIDGTITQAKNDFEKITGMKHATYLAKKSLLSNKLAAVAHEIGLFKRFKQKDQPTYPLPAHIKKKAQAEDALLLQIVVDYTADPLEKEPPKQKESSCSIS